MKGGWRREVGEGRLREGGKERRGKAGEGK